MGAGVLPTDIHNGKLVFLFGKESKYDTDNKNMYADFGGGQDYIEKSKIHWFSVDDLKKEKYKFKHWYRNIIDIIIKEEKQIYDFILKSNHKSSIKIKTRKNKRINKIYKKHHNTYNYRKNNI